MRNVIRAVALSAAAGLVLASCGMGDGGTTDDLSASPSPTSTVSVPPSVSMTEPGSDLAFGDSASVIFEPDRNRGTVLELTVEKVTKGSLEDFSGFILDDPYKQNASYYYVDVSVTNVGEGDVGDAPVPLYGVNGDNTSLPAVGFTTSFAKCESKPLPATFETGETFDICLVYLSPDRGTLEAVSFQPVQEFTPITWTGDIATPAPKPEPTKKPGTKSGRKN